MTRSERADFVCTGSIALFSGLACVFFVITNIAPAAIICGFISSISLIVFVSLWWDKLNEIIKETEKWQEMK